MIAERADRQYVLEPIDSSGIFLGLGIVQSALLGVGILTAVLAITAGLPLPLAAAPVVFSAIVSFSRISGRPAWEWLPLLSAWTLAGLRHRRSWSAPLPLWTQPSDRATPMPPCLSGLELVAVPVHAGGALGAVHDRQRQTLTAVISVSGPQFIVEARAEQERLLSAWGDVLSQFAVERGVVTHLAWSDLARPSGLTQHLDWLTNTTHGTRTPAAVASYDQLLGTDTTTATSHETVLTITVARDRLNHGHRTAGDREPLQRALVGAVDALLRALRAAGLAASDPYDQRGLQRLLRTRVDPVRPPVRVVSGLLTDRLANVQATTAGPMAVEAQWSHLHTDAAFHRSWWVGAWPRLSVPPSWLEPFLATGGVTRTMTVVLVPVPAHRSRRRIERDLVKLDSDATTREDKGRRVDARHRRATRALLEREEELVAGFSEIAYAGIVTVSAPDIETLDEHAEVVEQLAREHGMDLRVLHGRQDLAWAAGLPLGIAPMTVLAP